MAQAPQQPGTDGTAVVRNDRPLSLYDNLTAPGTGAGAAAVGRTIHFPDIQFRFDESIGATIPPSVGPTLDQHRRSQHRNSARSDFFGLSSPLERTTVADGQEERKDDQNVRTPPAPSPPPPLAPAPAASSTPVSAKTTAAPTTDDAVDMSALEASASPNSTQSTVQLSPAESPVLQQQHPTTPRSSRPNSTIKTITIQLPPDATIHRGSPSEAVYMTTTVPQNFAKNASTLIGRHKPTRSSLRHSRMLLQNNSKGYQQQRYQRGNSLNLRHLRLSKGLMVLQILIGALLSLIGLTIMVWSPSTHTKDNPYWSGLTLILCGTLFLVLFAFKRSDRRVLGNGGKDPATTADRPAPMSRNCFRENCFHVLRVNALVVLVLTIFFTLLAFIYALIHATNLSSPDLRCLPEFSFNVNASTCVCTLDPHALPEGPAGTGGEPGPVSTNRSLEEDGHRLEYRDFNCNEVLGIWYYVTIVSTVLNSLGCLLAASFLLIYGIECMRRDGIDHPPPVLLRKTNGENAPARDGEKVSGESESNQPLLATVRILDTHRVEGRADVAQQDSIARARKGNDQELPP
ncbi:hypothetical protein AND_003588 [Anopheles darlingi]|uniref:Uncharacterized protein n=1 Tax=Anopheles darlingi TaxID=43151 RepID=W5JPH3_ANODA|nr:hypothetical protein AND_003588 [Anopheles darlingi]